MYLATATIFKSSAWKAGIHPTPNVFFLCDSIYFNYKTSILSGLPIFIHFTVLYYFLLSYDFPIFKRIIFATLMYFEFKKMGIFPRKRLNRFCL